MLPSTPGEIFPDGIEGRFGSVSPNPVSTDTGMESASLVARLPIGIAQSIYPVQIRHQLGRALQSLRSSANHRVTHFAQGASAMQPHVDITRDKRQLRGYRLHVVVPPTFVRFLSFMCFMFLAGQLSWHDDSRSSWYLPGSLQTCPGSSGSSARYSGNSATTPNPGNTPRRVLPLRTGNRHPRIPSGNR